MTRIRFEQQAVSPIHWRHLGFAVASLLWLATSVAASAADTLLFDNLRNFGARYDVGDPSLQPTNAHGRILDGPKDIGVADLELVAVFGTRGREVAIYRLPSAEYPPRATPFT